MNELVPKNTDTKLELIKKYLLRARAYLPAEDEFLVERAQQIRDKEAKTTSIHLTVTEQWSFYELIEINELTLAWDELEWAFQRYSAMIRLGGGNLPCFDEWLDPHAIGASKAKFWHAMAMAAREMLI